MTPKRIAELRELCETATDGPWSIRQTIEFDGEWPMIYLRDVYGWGKDHDIADVCSSDPQCDARFIATARTALPDLLDEVERLKETTAYRLPPGLDPLKGAHRMILKFKEESDEARDTAARLLEECEMYKAENERLKSKLS